MVVQNVAATLAIDVHPMLRTIEPPGAWHRARASEAEKSKTVISPCPNRKEILSIVAIF